MRFVYISLLAAAVISNSLLIAILLKRRERSVSTTAFSLFLMCINIWGIPQLLINLSTLTLGYRFELLDKISSLGYVFIPVAFLVFALSFTQKQAVLFEFSFWLATLTPPFIFLFLSWATNLIDVHNPSALTLQHWGYNSPVGRLFSIFLAWFEAMMIFSMILIIRFRRHTSDIRKKKQAVFLIVAILIPLVLGTITDGVLPLLSVSVFPAAVPLTSIMAVIIVYAIQTYGLFELSPLTILTSIGEGVVTIDKKENIIHVNEPAQMLLHISKDELLGQSVFDSIVMYDEEDKIIPKQKRPAWIVLRKGKKVLHDNLFVLRGDGKKIPVAITATPAFVKNSIVGATLILRDITREKELERNKDDFISIASHELKTPITSLQLYFQILQKKLATSPDRSLRALLEKADDQIVRITTLITDLLDMSRIQSGKMALHQETFALDDLVSEIAENFRQITPGHKIEIKSSPRMKLFADRDRIRQVLVNFLSNAIKYSPPHKSIHVFVRRSDKRVIVAVKDFGIGIEESKQQQIFQRFYRIEGDSRKHVSGLGIGLYICKQIIRQHGGEIWVESKPQDGSTFYFSLPLRK